LSLELAGIMNSLVRLLLFILFSISTPLLGQQVPVSPGAIDDGPYFFKSNDTIAAIWIKNNNLYSRIILPDNFAGIRSMFGFSFNYNYLVKTFRQSPGFSQKFTDVDNICVISDIHGNFESYITLLKGASVIDGNLRWKFGKGHLVILGDIFDRGEKVTEILWHVFDLEKQALGAGGRVHLILGNHELMVLSGDLRYIHEKYLITLGYRDENILYHELAHIAQDKLGYNMNSHPYSHIVVELVSCVLCYLVGKNLDFSESFNYIQERAEWKNKTVLDACTKVLYQTKRIVLFVLEESEISPRKFNKNVMLWPPLGW